MDDLYAIFKQRLAAGISSLHPHRWLKQAFCGRSIFEFDCMLQPRSLFSIAAEEGAPLTVIGGRAVTNASEGRAALRSAGRHSACGLYLGNARLSWSYRTHSLFAVQDGVKDLLKERMPGIRFEVRTPAGSADCVSPTTLYEVAPVTAWKQALGQVLAYASHLPRRRKILWLFGEEVRPNRLGVIRETCSRYAVNVNYMRYTERAFGSRKTRSELPAAERPPELHGCGNDRSRCMTSWLMSAVDESAGNV